MATLQELTKQWKTGVVSREQFIQACVDFWVEFEYPPYPETDSMRPDEPNRANLNMADDIDWQTANEIFTRIHEAKQSQ